MWLCYCAAAVFKFRISNKVESGTAELGDSIFCEDSSLFCFSIRYVPRVKRKKTKTEKVRFTTHCTPRSRFKNISRGGRPETPSRTRAQAFVRVRVQVPTVESNLRRPRILIHVLCSSRNSCMTESFFGPLESKHLFWR